LHGSSRNILEGSERRTYPTAKPTKGPTVALVGRPDDPLSNHRKAPRTAS
jgi:hypothetical protein